MIDRAGGSPARWFLYIPLVPISFDILEQAEGCGARVGRIVTPHGSFDTPAFMPVGTRAALRGLLPRDVADTGSQIVLANTFHLMLRPGAELIEELGGLHRFMNWPGPILTDSGGYQVYSLSDCRTITDDSVVFKSIIDGSMVELTPQRSIEIQHKLGADLIMAFDDCPPSVDPRLAQRAGKPPGARRVKAHTRDDHARRLEQACERTIRWLERCAAFHRQSGREDRQALFGIVQGGTDPDRRRRCVEQVCSVDLPGYAIGGVAVGEGFEEIAAVVEHTAPLLPEDKPRYLMGVGYERDLVTAVRAGCDMFDCVLPTRNGRNANAFTPTGQIRLRNAQFASDHRPIDPGCDCPVCTGWGQDAHPFSRAYLRHLFQAGEMLGPILVSLHNVRHFQRLMVDIRSAIRDNGWSDLTRRWPVIEPDRARADAADAPG